jgi:hypothetical protein
MLVRVGLINRRRHRLARALPAPVLACRSRWRFGREGITFRNPLCSLVQVDGVRFLTRRGAEIPAAFSVGIRRGRVVASDEGPADWPPTTTTATWHHTRQRLPGENSTADSADEILSASAKAGLPPIVGPWCSCKEATFAPRVSQGATPVIKVISTTPRSSSRSHQGQARCGNRSPRSRSRPYRRHRVRSRTRRCSPRSAKA